MIEIESTITAIAAEAEFITTPEQRRKWAEYFRREHDDLKVRIRAQVAK
jgi:hypothetical protein